MDTASAQRLLEEGIPFVKKTGVKVVELAKAQVKLRLPHDPTNLNPMGILHAGATFTLAETTAAALCLMAFGMGRVMFVGKEVDIRFKRPGKGDALASAALAEADAARILEAALRDGKTDAPVDVTITDPAGEPIATATVTMSVRKLG